MENVRCREISLYYLADPLVVVVVVFSHGGEKAIFDVKVRHPFLENEISKKLNYNLF